MKEAATLPGRLEPLTPVEQQVLAALRAHDLLSPQHPPTRLQLALQLGYSRTAAPNRQLASLRRKGWIDWRAHQPCSLRLTPQCRRWFAEQATPYDISALQAAAARALQKRIQAQRKAAANAACQPTAAVHQSAAVGIETPSPSVIP